MADHERLGIFGEHPGVRFALLLLGKRARFSERAHGLLVVTEVLKEFARLYIEASPILRRDSLDVAQTGRILLQCVAQRPPLSVVKC